MINRYTIWTAVVLGALVSLPVAAAKTTDRPLVNAAKRVDLIAVQALIDEGIDVDQQSVDMRYR